MSDLVLQRAGLAVRDPGPHPFMDVVDEELHECVREAHGHGEVETTGQEEGHDSRNDGGHNAPADRLRDASFVGIQILYTINPIELIALYEPGSPSQSFFLTFRCSAAGRHHGKQKIYL